VSASFAKRTLTFIAALLLSAFAALAQMNTGEIAGAVHDPSGAVVPGASVVATQSATQQKRTVATNDAGQFFLAQLPVGEYSLSVSAPGFNPLLLPSVTLHVGERLQRDFTLAVGEQSTMIVVEAAESALQLESAEIKDVIRQEQVISLPLKARQFLDLAMLSEGVVRPPGGTRGDALQQAGALVNILGQRSGHNLYLVDGVSVTDQHFNNMVIAPSVDSIQEFNIEKTSYTPEFGGKSGAVINVITKSGTNDLHGSLFEFFRNDIFDAKNYFDSPSEPTPPFRQNQFGATLGGPIVRSKTFFFLSYEGQRVRKSLTQTFSVPAEEMRAGDFSGFPVVYDPLTGDPGTGQRMPFAGNMIPTDRLDPVALAMLARIPFPNLPGTSQNLRATETQSLTLNQYSGRLDHQLAGGDRLYARVSVFDANQFDPFGSGVLQESLLPGFGRNLRTHSFNSVLGWTRSLTPTLLNEARFGWLSVSGGQSSPNAGIDFAALSGLQGVTANPLDMGYPQFSFGGEFSTMGDPASFVYRDNRSIEFYDNVAWLKGNHTIKFGGYFYHLDFRPVNPNGARGIFSFTPRWTSSSASAADGSAFADFLLGYPTTAQVGLGRAELDANANWLHLYIQDGWQVTPSFRFDVGVRYEFNQNMTDSQNRMAAVDTLVPGGRFVVASDENGNISAPANLLAAIPIPWTTSKDAGWNNSLLNTSYLRFAPRVGLAWSLPDRFKTVVRAGFGVYPNQAAYGIITNFAQNLPFFAVKTVNTSPSPAPAFSTQTMLATNALGTVGATNLDHRFLIEYNEVWNLNLEHQLTPTMALAAAYIGSRTVHADSATVLNVPEPGPGAIAPRRPIPQLSGITSIRWDGWADYQALTLKFSRRIARTLMFDANWTWSHSIDDASDPGATTNEANLPQNVRDFRAEKASSSFDHRHRFVANFVWPIPFPAGARGWSRALLADWQASGAFVAQSGAPFTVNIPGDQANIGNGPAQRPNINGDPNQGPRTPDQWFDTSVFSLPAPFTFGNAPRNSVIGPGLVNVDFSLQKDFLLSEGLRFQWRAEAYNLFNHPNFNIPNRIAFTSNFGKISSAQDSRQFQFALKLAF
jgi:hypothetical protein